MTQKRPFIRQKGPILMAKEAYSYGKRGLFIWQKRPIHISIPEVCVSVKRDLFTRQKRPIHISTRETPLPLPAVVAIQMHHAEPLELHAAPRACVRTRSPAISLLFLERVREREERKVEREERKGGESARRRARVRACVREERTCCARVRIKLSVE